jgi:hypothetical protein
MFAPVARELRLRGAEPVAISLDPFYGQGAEDAARAHGLRSVSPRWEGTAPAGGFYRRRPTAVWRDVLSARAPVEALLESLAPARLVVGNDFGLIEKLALASSRDLGVPRRVLVQDGRLGARRPLPASARAALRRPLQRALSPLLRAARRPSLAASEYAEGGAELICASGPAAAALLRRRAGRSTRIVITGQPRYDRLAGLRRPPSDGPLRVLGVFTTPFAQAGFGSALQEAQAEAVGSLSRALAAEGIGVVVKHHPRESPEIYAGLAPEVAGGDPAAVLERVDAAVIGASTVLEEAALAGCPVIVPGRLVHPRRWRRQLPDPALFPRFDSVDQARMLVSRLRSAAERRALSERQRAAVLADVEFGTPPRAAAAVADAILAP